MKLKGEGNSQASQNSLAHEKKASIDSEPTRDEYLELSANLGYDQTEHQDNIYFITALFRIRQRR